MQPLNVIVAQADCVAAEHLTASLHKHFRTVAVARDLDEIRREIARIRADAVILDLELSSFEELEDLCRQFQRVAIVCTHRVPDEIMWAAALERGASDCCARADVKGLVEAVCKSAQPASTARAA